MGAFLYEENMTEKKDNVKQLKLAKKEQERYFVSEENLETLVDIVIKSGKELDRNVDNEALKALLSLAQYVVDGSFDEVVLLGVNKQGGIFMGGGGDSGNKFMVSTILKEYASIFHAQLAEGLGLYDVEILED